MPDLSNPFTIMLLVFYLPLVVGILRVWRVLRYRRFPRTEGVVVDSYEHQVGGDMTNAVTREMVEFTTREGDRVVAEPFHDILLPRSRRGREVTVFYDPADPQKIYAPVTPLTGSGLIYLLIGLPLAVFASFALAGL